MTNVNKTNVNNSLMELLQTVLHPYRVPPLYYRPLLDKLRDSH